MPFDRGSVVPPSKSRRQAGWRLVVKRFLDCTVAGLGLVFAAPVLALTALLIRATLGSPVLFRQDRTGHLARPFRILKFRTMSDALGPDGEPLEDGARLTGLGRAIRRASIDELPQLWNVLLGDLSLVGPRPLLPKYVGRYTPEQARRHEVLPGITGWAQVNGRNAISWEQRFALDVWYVDNWSLLLDLRILSMTIARVIGRSGVSSEGHATMPEFLGTRDEQDRPGSRTNERSRGPT